ncbi:MAG: hypothetical protein Q4D81_06990 [Eubacteriales bacterium]|nr:hypothetical protein [Eubacteriales bacterium]
MKNKVINRAKPGHGKLRIGAARVMLTVIVMTAAFGAVPQKASAVIYNLLFTCTVKVEKGYLALRTAPKYDKKNEIGKLYTGDTVVECPTNRDDNGYCYVYSPKLHKHGYVNADYIEYKGEYDGRRMSVKVETGYLALRNAKAFKKSNEIGKLYTGEEVIILDDSDPDYWTVYAPTLYKTGYVNCDYLVSSLSPITDDTREVPVGIAKNSRGEYQQVDGYPDYLSIRIQVTNYSSYKTAREFDVIVYAEDMWGRKIYGDNTYYRSTTVKNIKPGETVYSDFITIPDRSRIRKVYAAVKRAVFTDGTIREYEDVPLDGYGRWEIE